MDLGAIFAAAAAKAQGDAATEHDSEDGGDGDGGAGAGAGAGADAGAGAGAGAGARASRGARKGGASRETDVAISDDDSDVVIMGGGGGGGGRGGARGGRGGGGAGGGGARMSAAFAKLEKQACKGDDKAFPEDKVALASKEMGITIEDVHYRLESKRRAAQNAIQEAALQRLIASDEDVEVTLMGGKRRRGEEGGAGGASRRRRDGGGGGAPVLAPHEALFNAALAGEMQEAEGGGAPGGAGASGGGGGGSGGGGGGGAEAAAAKPGTVSMVFLKFQSDRFANLTIQTSMTSKLEKVFDAYCKKFEIPENQRHLVKFTCNGEVMRGHLSCEGHTELSLEEADTHKGLPVFLIDAKYSGP